MDLKGFLWVHDSVKAKLKCLPELTAPFAQHKNLLE